MTGDHQERTGNPCLQTQPLFALNTPGLMLRKDGFLPVSSEEDRAQYASIGWEIAQDSQRRFWVRPPENENGRQFSEAEEVEMKTYMQVTDGIGD